MNRTAAWALLVGLALAVSAGLAWQWQTTALLRIEVDRLREVRRESLRLQADNERLKRESLSTSELEQLRADHAAMEQLRTELETLRAASGGR